MTRPRGKPHDIRLYVEQPLTEGQALTLAKDQTHYLTRVMRLKDDDALKVFNGQQGEWQARIRNVLKNSLELVPEQQLREQSASPNIQLLFAPIKKAGTDLIIEKATELGVSRLTPLITERTQTHRLNLERAGIIAREAAEQCERLDLPQIDEPISLPTCLKDWPANRALLVMAERSQGETLSATAPSTPPPAALLIGPEGGLTSEELDAMTKLPFVTAVSLGPRILRAETAALSALAIWQALSGDGHASSTSNGQGTFATSRPSE